MLRPPTYTHVWLGRLSYENVTKKVNLSCINLNRAYSISFNIRQEKVQEKK